MVSRGLLVRLDARPDKEQVLQNFLRSAPASLAHEDGTTAWFAVRFGRGQYGIFDAFPGDAAREAHLAGQVAQALHQLSGELFETPPRVQKFAILANKLPIANVASDTKGLLLTFKAKPGHEAAVEEFLHDAEAMVLEEHDTTAWFAIQTDDGAYGIFDVFPDSGARFAHLTGHVPRALVKHSLTLLGSMPELEMVNVEAERLVA